MAEASGVLAVLEMTPRILSDLEPDQVLTRVLEVAREISGAKYAAIGVLDPSRRELQRFITLGIDDDTRRRIGDPPRGRGVLGELIEHPVPLRLPEVGGHPYSYGFPPEHPRMETFLGVPVMAGSQPYGNLYLTEKRNGEPFTADDEEAVVLLAKVAGAAIDHARRYSVLDARHAALRHTAAALDASLQIAQSLGGETDLGTILTLVAKRGRALVCARLLVIEHEQAGEMIIAAGAGDIPEGLIGQRVHRDASLGRLAMRTGATVRLEDAANMARFERHGLGRLGVRARAGLVVPLIFRGDTQGVLIAVDRLRDGPSFSCEDRRLLEAFATSAATAISTAASADARQRGQLRSVADVERARWASVLRDQTVARLDGVCGALDAQLLHADPGPLADAVAEAVAALEQEVGELRSLITDVGPAAAGADSAATAGGEVSQPLPTSRARRRR